MTNLLLLGWGSEGKGFRLLSDHIEGMSAAGLILLGVLAFVTILLAVTGSLWFTAIVRRICARRCPGLEWVAVPKVGGGLAIAVFFAVFPVFSVFSDRSDSWWLFLLFGWLAAAMTLYYTLSVRHMSTAVMKADGVYYLSRNCGLGGWVCVEGLNSPCMHEEKYSGVRLFSIVCKDTDSGSGTYAYISLTNYPLSEHKHLMDFLKSF